MQQKLTTEQVWNNLQGAAIRGEITDDEAMIIYTKWLDEKGILYEVKEGKVCIKEEEPHSNGEYAELLELYAKKIRRSKTPLDKEEKELIGYLGKKIYKRQVPRMAKRKMLKDGTGIEPIE